MMSSASVKAEGSANVLEKKTVTFTNIVLSFPLHSTIENKLVIAPIFMKLFEILKELLCEKKIVLL